MNTISVRIEGVSPLMMHNRRLANPLDPTTKLLKAATSKMKKTDDDHLEIAHLEFLGGIYHDDKIGVYIPGENIDATLRNAAKTIKKGTAVQRGVITIEDKVALIYEGPRSPEALWNKGFYDLRSVSAQGRSGGSRIMRCRPLFQQWGCVFTIGYQPTLIEDRDLKQIVEVAGTQIGLNDYRPRFGKFQIVEWKAG